jgi:hypothetical protein
MERVISVLKSCKINMIQICKEDINESKLGNEFAKFALPKLQELLICNVANNRSDNLDIEFLPIKKYLQLKKIKWSHDLDAKLGDIIVVYKGTTIVICCIDLKVADDGPHKIYYPQNRLFVGCIDAYSYKRFAEDATGNIPHIYLCMSYDGSEYILIDAIKLRNCIGANKSMFKYNKTKEKYYIPSCWFFDNESKICI